MSPGDGAKQLDEAPEVVSDAALVVDPDDVEGLTEAMLRVVREPGLFPRLRELGLEQARRFSWDDSARRLPAELQQAGGRPSVETR
jgi:glycosyltransferase involved in cell wall biosynthesis